jgi:hypothetical protein
VSVTRSNTEYVLPCCSAGLVHAHEIVPPPKSLDVLVLCQTVLLLKSTLNELPFHHVPFPPALSDEIATSTFPTPDTPSNAVPAICVTLAFANAPGVVTAPVGKSTS